MYRLIITYTNNKLKNTTFKTDGKNKGKIYEVKPYRHDEKVSTSLERLMLIVCKVYEVTTAKCGRTSYQSITWTCYEDYKPIIQGVIYDSADGNKDDKEV